MSDVNGLIEQMGLDIATQAFQLDDQRLRLFLNWLMDHSSEMKVSLGTLLNNDFRILEVQKRFQSVLITWLQTLPAQGLLWEYRTVIADIEWWHDLEPGRLKMIVRLEGEK